MTTTSDAKPEGLIIDGQRVGASDGGTFDDHDPSSGDLLARCAKATRADVRRAVESARGALDSKRWGGLPPADRGRILFRIAHAIREVAEELATLESRDNGKNWSLLSTLSGQHGSEAWDDPASQPPGHLGISGFVTDPSDSDNFFAIVQGVGAFETDDGGSSWTPRNNGVWKPTICAINGLVAGAGLHFVSECDIVIGIFCHRIGTELPSTFAHRLPDDSPYPSGSG